MAVGETAQLAVELRLNGVVAYTSGIAKAEAATATLGRTASSGLTSGLAKAEKGLNSLSSHLGHAKNAIGGLLTGPLGIIGLSAGLFSLGGILEGSLRHTSDFALGIEKLTGLTGESAQSMGSLILLFEKYGLSVDRTSQIVGFAEKTLGKLNETQAKTGKSTKLLALEHEKLAIQLAGGKTKAIDLAIAHQKAADAIDAARNSLTKLDVLDVKYGLHLKDAKGHVVDFTTELNQIAAYYTSSASASDKAYVASTLLGRGYAALIPVLKLGTAGIKEAADEAANLGLHLDQTNVVQLAQYRESLRSLGEAFGILQLGIGTELAPDITNISNGIKSFLEHGGAKQIVQFFRDGAKFAEQMGKAVQDYVVPVFQGIAGAWAKLPEPLKGLLIAGFAVNKASKFLFDFSPAGAAQTAVKSIFSRGGNPAEPLFVKDVGVSGPGGGLGGGGLSLLGAAGAITLAAGIAEAIREAVDFRSQQDALVAGGLTRPQALQSQLDSMSPSSSAYALHHGAYLGLPSASGSGGLSPDERQAMEDAAQKLQDVKDASQGTATEIIAMGRASQNAANAQRSLAHLLADKNWLEHLAKGIHDRSVQKFGGKGLGSAAEQATYQRDILGKAASIERHGAGSVERLERLKQLLKDAKNATDATKQKLSADIKALQATIHKQKPPQVTVNVATNVEVSANSIIKKYNNVQRYGPSDPTHKHGGRIT